MRKINLRLAEGAECKELLVERNRTIKTYDTVISYQARQLSNMRAQDSVTKLKLSMIEFQRNTAVSDQVTASRERDEAIQSRDTEKKRKRTWRSLSLIQSAVLVGIGYLIFK